MSTQLTILGRTRHERILVLADVLLEAYEPGQKRIILRTSQGIVLIRNAYDELAIQLSKRGRVPVSPVRGDSGKCEPAPSAYTR